MTIAAFRKLPLSVGARVVFGSTLLLGVLAAPVFAAESPTAVSATAPVVRGATGRQLWRVSDYTTVELVAREPGAPDNQHPWTIEPNTLHALLQQVQVMRGGAAKPLFAIDELNAIVPELAEALANARADQDIALVSSARHEDNTFYGISAVTARLFVVDGHLNMIVHDSRVDFYDAARGSGMAPHFTLGSRTAEGVLPVQSSSATNKRFDWLVLSAASTPPAPPVAPAARPRWRRRPRRPWRRRAWSRRSWCPPRRRLPAPRQAPPAPAAPARRRRRAAPAHDQAPLRQGPDHQVRVREEAPGNHQGTVIAASRRGGERLQRQGVGGRGARRGVVEDHPGHRAFGPSGQGRGLARQPGVVVARPVHARRAVPAVVQQRSRAVAGRPQPAAGALRAGVARRIRGHARDLQRSQRTIGAGLEPAGVTRFAGDRPVPRVAQESEKRAREAGVPGQRGRQLHEQHAQPIAEAGGLGRGRRAAACARRAGARHA